jgi:hypothetical protein
MLSHFNQIDWDSQRRYPGQGCRFCHNAHYRREPRQVGGVKDDGTDATECNDFHPNSTRRESLRFPVDFQTASPNA